MTIDEDSSGRFSTYGTELIISANLTDHWTGEAGITYQKTKNKNDPNLDVAYSPELLLHLKTFFYPGIDNGDGTYGRRVGASVDGYVVLDANIRVENIFSNLYLNLRTSNLQDTEIRYPNNGNNNTLLDEGTLGEGLEIMATIGVSF